MKNEYNDNVRFIVKIRSPENLQGSPRHSQVSKEDRIKIPSAKKNIITKSPGGLSSSGHSVKNSGFNLNLTVS